MKVSKETESLIINVWNNTSTPFSDEKNIHQLFEEKANLQPNQTALISSSTCLSYNELNKRANQFARELIEYGIITGDFIGIYLPRDTDLIVTLLAILKVGAAYVPLNLSDPVDRITRICKASNIKFIISNNNYKDIISSTLSTVITTDQLKINSISLSDANIAKPVYPNNSAYIIFTSGTTGIPKGVHVKHKPVINLIEWVNNTFKVNSTDKLIWTTNLSFDLSVYDIFGVLAAGGSIRILDDQERLDPELQLRIMIEENITFWDSAPQSLQVLAPYISDYINKISETSLRLVFLSGDWIPLQLPNEIKSLFTKAQTVGLGGATEATVWSNYFIINEINPNWKSIPYGKPIQNSKYYILNSELEHCDILNSGDLYIGGICLASEYYNDIELTNQKFIDDPFYPGGKLYFTGDKAQWMPDGNIEFLGREDLQVKIRGYRVELGEIKQAALSIANIKDCVIVPDKTNPQDIKVLLFYIEHKSSAFDNKVLKEELQKMLPNYMIPAGFYSIDNFPITSNGKIDNKSLLEFAKFSNQDFNESQVYENSHNDFNDTERKLLSIFIELLKTRKIEETDNFFDIGGNSLLVLSMVSKIKNAFDVNINIRDIFASPTIKSISQLIDFKLNIYKGFSKEPESLDNIIEGEI